MKFPLQLIPPNTKFDFVSKRFYAFAISAIMVIASIGFYGIYGLNFGIDFAGGTLVEVRTNGSANLDRMRRDLNAMGIGEVALQGFGSPDDVLIRLPRQEGGEEAQLAAVEQIKKTLGDQVSSYRRVEFVGPKVGAELVRAGIVAVLLSLVGIMVYVWFRFEWQFGVGAIVATGHDVISTIGLFAFLGHEFNLTTLAAVLTIAGYSINDTVVVFDRIRENLRKYKTMPMTELMNLSVNETLSRTVLTSSTTLLALGAIYFFGGAVLSDFALALIWGIVVGTFSSIYVAAPFVMYLDVRRNSSGKPETAEADKATKVGG